MVLSKLRMRASNRVEDLTNTVWLLSISRIPASWNGLLIASARSLVLCEDAPPK